MGKTRLMLLSCLVPVAAFSQVSPHGSTRFACRTCHVGGSQVMRLDSVFDHALTGYVLTDKHKKVECASCHGGMKFSLLETNCESCHQDVHRDGRSVSCAQCHVTQAWLGAEMMRQHEKGRFLLKGGHEAVPCKQCHVGGNFALVFTGCQQCHEGKFWETRSPDHVAANFDHDCRPCHSTKGWTPATFDHASTRFPLTGAHASIPCAACHVNANYGLHYTDCFPCHESQYAQSVNPNHAIAGFPHDCYPCHSTAAWRPSTFTHDQQNFPIFRGRHRDQWAACSDCHQNTANFAYFSCLGCHAEGPTNQRHATVSNYSFASPACYMCHRDV